MSPTPPLSSRRWASSPPPTLSRKDSNGDPKISVLLDEPPAGNAAASSSHLKPDIKGKGPARASAAGRAIPLEYKLTLQNTATKNMYVFGEKEEEVKESGEVGHRKRRRESFAVCWSSNVR